MGLALYLGGMYSHPSFLVLGAKKAGTTWLYDVLKQHPDVWLTPKKEMMVNFFFDPVQVNKYRKIYYDQMKAGEFMDQAMVNNPQTLAFINHYFANVQLDMHWYRRCFSDFSEGKMAGDIDPNLYILPQQRINELATVFPQMKVMLVLRNPMKQAWSHLKMITTQRFGEGAGKLTPRELLFIMTDRTIINLCAFSSIVPLWQRAFGDRLLLSSYDQICLKPQEIISQTLAHIGVEDRAITAPASNVGAKWAMPDELKTMIPDFYEKELDYLQSLMPEQTFSL